MTCMFSEIPNSVIDTISTRITNNLGSKINRVVYDVTHKPPGTVEWE
jgi:GMP synthase PP-ATPase subunit